MRRLVIAIVLFGAGASILVLYRIGTNSGGVSDLSDWILVALFALLILSPYFRLYRKAELLGKSTSGVFAVIGIVALGLVVMMAAFAVGHTGGVFLVIGPALQHWSVWIATSPTSNVSNGT